MGELQSSTWTREDFRNVFSDAKAVWQWLRALLTSKRRHPDAEATSSEGDAESEATPGILIIGPGGAGKSTFAKLIAGQLLPWVFGETWEYSQSFGEEVYQLLGETTVEIVVPAGQLHRQAAAWADVRADISAGRYCGIILTAAFGYHNYTGSSYRHHELYKNDLDQFREEYTVARRGDECQTLGYLLPALLSTASKLWLLTLVTKQDLWWKDRLRMEQFYASESWAGKLAEVVTAVGVKRFRHEVCPVSLTLSNLKDPEGFRLFKTTEGYDLGDQAESLKRLFVAFDALRVWGEQK